MFEDCIYWRQRLQFVYNYICAVCLQIRNSFDSHYLKFTSNKTFSEKSSKTEHFLEVTGSWQQKPPVLWTAYVLTGTLKELYNNISLLFLLLVWRSDCAMVLTRQARRSGYEVRVKLCLKWVLGSQIVSKLNRS